MDFGARTPFGSGFRGEISAAPQTLVSTLADYKRQVARRYRVLEPELIERALPDERLYISEKFDGELWFLVKHAETLALVAYNGRSLVQTDLLRPSEELCAGPDFIYAGELIARTSAGRPRHGQVPISLSDARYEAQLEFLAFDVVSHAQLPNAAAAPFADRVALLERSLGEAAAPKNPRCRVLPQSVGSPSELAKLYRALVVEGDSEGVVARSDRGLTYKIKPTQTLDFVVLAFGERIVGATGQRELRELEVGLLRDDGSFQLVGAVGGGFRDEERKSWHDRLSAIAAPSRFRLANREGTLCRFVRPELVVEVRVSDLLTQDSWDQPIRRMSLAYDAEGYRPLSETRTAVPIHPVFLRLREDKNVDVASVGVTQIQAHLQAGDLQFERAAATTTSIGSIKVKRGVYIKDTKGVLAVRKFVLIKTQKEALGSHPPYVCFFSDFSPGRKEPLATALRTAPTLAEAERQVAEWIAENVKKGWVEANAANAANAENAAAGPSGT